MIAKNERFEMRVDEEALERVDAWRAKQRDFPSRAESIRRLVQIGLAVTENGAVQFTDGEKLLILMMRDLLKHLTPANPDIEVDFLAEVIWGGHYWAPKWKMPGVFHGYQDDPRNLSIVLDVLEMWEFIERGYEKLSDQDKQRVDQEAASVGTGARFLGFDGNGDGGHLGIAEFLVNKLERFTRFKDRDLNSHMPTLSTYKRMLAVFKPMRGGLVGRELDAGQIVAVLRAEPKGR